MTSAAARLPSRVRHSIADLQHRSELLVAGVQLGVAAMLLLLYYVAPVDHAPDAPVFSAPLGLSLFSILVLVRLWFAWTRQLSPLFLGFSSMAEMAVLVFTIWTYHLEFETGPAINLKNTHTEYIYVLIALRALRFEPLWVVLSGLAGAAGWGLVVWHALKVAGREIVTWDYVTYASSRSLYPGAEFDKLLAIVLVTGIIALVLARARDTLFRAVTQTQATEDLSRFFDKEVADKITHAEDRTSAGHAERRNAAIMFIDMRGFTPASKQLSPDDLIALLGEYQALTVSAIRAHNGSIDKFLGDGILASFGAATASGTYAADALRAAQDIMQAATEWTQRRLKAGLIAPSVGLAIASGEIVFGVIGYGDRLEYTVLGDAVNLAAKLEKHTKAEKVRSHCDLETYELARRQGFAPELEVRKDRSVAGNDTPVSIAVIAA